METEEKVSNKLMINCREASFLEVKKEAGDINAWQRLQLGFHGMMCKVCKLWNKQSAQLNTIIKNAFACERHKMCEKKKAEMEKEIDQLFI